MIATVGDVPESLMLPVQFYGPGRRTVTPERSLALAVMHQAIEDIIRPVVQGNSVPRHLRPQALRRTRDQAVSWVMSDDGRWPYSFVSLCEQLGLDAAAIRTAVRHLIEQAEAA